MALINQFTGIAFKSDLCVYVDMSDVTSPFTDGRAIQRDIKTLQQSETLLTQWLAQPLSATDDSQEKEWLSLANQIETTVGRLEKMPLSDEFDLWLRQYKYRMKGRLSEMAAYSQQLKMVMESMRANKSAAWAYQKSKTIEQVIS